MTKIDTDRGLQARMIFVMVLLAVVGVGFAAFVGYMINSMIVAMLMVTVIAILQYTYGAKIALKSMGAKRVNNDEYPELHSMVNKMAQQANMPKPDVAVAETPVQNAFAAGRSQGSSVVCVTTGLMNSLDEDELEGVIAHEVTHIKNRDVVVMTVAGLITMITGIILRYSIFFNPTRGRGGEKGAIAFVAILAASVVTYIIGFLLIRALSRYREYAADRGAAQLTGKPMALAEALRTIDDSMDNTPEEDLRDARGANALMISPVKSKLTAVFSTHPKTENRIERLNSMSKDMNN